MSEIELLKQQLAAAENLAEWCTLAVFIGLVIEYLWPLWEKRKALKSKDFVLPVIGGVLIAGGVGGEYLYGSRASSAATKLTNISELRVAEANALAAEASKSISLLKVELATAERGIADARKAAAGFQTQIATANARTAEAVQDTAQLRLDLTSSNKQLAAEQIKLQQEQQKTAQAQVEAAKFQQESVRFLASGIRGREPDTNLLGNLKTLPKATVEIVHLDDVEANFFASLTKQFLEGYGWTVSGSVAVPASKFTGETGAFPLWGTTIWNNKTGGFIIGGNIIPKDVHFITEMLSAGEKEPMDLRVAILIAALGATTHKDTSLAANSFKIVIGPRDPFNPFR